MTKFRPGWALLIVLALLPAVVWFINTPGQFDGFTSIMSSLGKLAGLVGMALFALAFVLNTRLKIIERLFGGLLETYSAHHMVGAISFVLILFHPLFLASRLLMSSVADAALFLLPSSDWAINTGILALLSMELFLVFTFFIRIRYDRWKLTHRLLGLSFILASIHVLLIPSDVSQDLWLRGVMIGFIVAGLLAFGYRTLLWRWVVPKHEYRLKKVRRLSDAVTEVTLTPADGPISYLPGQFVFLTFQGQKAVSREQHPFTVSSAPHEHDLRLTIKSLGDFTQNIKELTVGRTVYVEGPYGVFSSRLYPGRQVWIAGGIGITPFLSMARDLEISHAKDRVDLYYCVREQDEAVYLQELQDLAKHNHRFHLHLVCTSVDGRLDAEAVVEKNGVQGEFFICGPQPMIAGMKQQLRELGVTRRRLHAEEFGFT